jgi:hypothetical protein
MEGRTVKYKVEGTAIIPFVVEVEARSKKHALEVVCGLPPSVLTDNAVTEETSLDLEQPEKVG